MKVEIIRTHFTLQDTKGDLVIDGVCVGETLEKFDGFTENIYNKLEPTKMAIPKGTFKLFLENEELIVDAGRAGRKILGKDIIVKGKDDLEPLKVLEHFLSPSEDVTGMIKDVKEAKGSANKKKDKLFKNLVEGWYDEPKKEVELTVKRFGWDD